MNAKRNALFVAVLCVAMLAGCASAPARGRPAFVGMERSAEKIIKNLSPDYRAWLEDEWIVFIITKEELDALAKLTTSWDFETFKLLFWERRSYDGRGFRIDFKDVYRSRVNEAKELYGSFHDPRAKAFVILGPPDSLILINGRYRPGVQTSSCNEFVPIEIWSYALIESLSKHDAVLIFYCEMGMCGQNGSGWKLWLPTIGEKVFTQGLMRRFDESPTQRELDRVCKYEAEKLALAKWMAEETLNNRSEQDIFRLKEIDAEWVNRVVDMRTDVNPHAERLTVIRYYDPVFSLDERNKSKVNVDLRLLLSVHGLRERVIGDQSSYNIGATVRVLEKSSRGWEAYNDPATNKSGGLTPEFVFYKEGIEDGGFPISVSLDLYPAEYKVFIKLADRNRGPSEPAEAVWEQNIKVPLPQAMTPSSRSNHRPIAQLASAIGLRTGMLSGIRAVQGVAPAQNEVENNEMLSEKTLVIELIVPEGEPLTNLQTFRVRVAQDVRRVDYFLDGKKVASVNQAPFSTNLRLATIPRSQTVRVVAYSRADAYGEPIGEYEQVVNDPYRNFQVHIISPAQGATVSGKIDVQAVVQNITKDQEVERVDYFLDDAFKGSLSGPPYSYAMKFPASISVIRVTAVLKSGVTAEDFRIVNGGGYIEHVEVNLVELYVTVLDKNGKSVRGLAKSDFRVFEKKTPQTIRRFSSDFPLSVGIALDTSGSMDPAFLDALQAAGDFIAEVLRSRDKGFTMGIGDNPYFLAEPTRDKKELLRSLTRARARGRSAIWDGILFGIYRLRGLPTTPAMVGGEMVDMDGKRALVLLTGEARMGNTVYLAADNASQSSYDVVLRYAQESDVAIYVIGLDVQKDSKEFRKSIEKLTEATGGKVYYAKDVEDLAGVYKEIGNELRSQYYISYQSDPPPEGKAWRPLEVNAKNKEFAVRHKPGYYP